MSLMLSCQKGHHAGDQAGQSPLTALHQVYGGRGCIDALLQPLLDGRGCCCSNGAWCCCFSPDALTSGQYVAAGKASAAAAPVASAVWS